MDDTYLEEDPPITWASAWEHLADMQEEIVQAAIETALMLGIGLGAALLFGLPLGVLLYLTRRGNMADNPWLHGVLSWVVNLVRSFPFIILMVAMLPVANLIVGTSLGNQAMIVTLVIAATPYVARMVEASMKEVGAGVIEAAQAMGTSSLKIIWKVLIPEAKPALLTGGIISMVTILGYSAMAGVIGGGGLGKIAITYGYQRYNDDIVWICVFTVVYLMGAL